MAEGARQGRQFDVLQPLVMINRRDDEKSWTRLEGAHQITTRLGKVILSTVDKQRRAKMQA